MEEQTSIAVVIAFAVLTSALLIAFIIIIKAKENRTLMRLEMKAKEEQYEATLNAEAATRDRIYNNLHDQVNPLLRNLMRSIELHQRNAEKGISVSTNDYEKDIDLALVILNDLKSCTHEMLPTFLLDFGLIKALEHEFYRQGESARVVTTVLVHDGLTELEIKDKNKLLNSYRMLTAILDNIFRHSECKKCSMAISGGKDTLRIVFTHDGAGISNEQAMEFSKNEHSTGLKSIVVRAIIIKATVDYSLGPPAGIHIHIPA